MTNGFQEISIGPPAWVLPSNVLTSERLDASYYEPQYLRAAAQLEALPCKITDFRQICVKVNCGATPKLVVYGDTGIPLIRTSNVRPNLYDSTDTLRVPGFSIQRESNVAILPEDVLYTMSGSVGYAAVYPESGELASCSNTIARGRIEAGSENNPYYVAAFLNSSLGKLQSERLVSGGVLGHVMPTSVKRLRVALPSADVQRAIGNRFRKVERLRNRAKLLRESAFQTIDHLFGSTDWTNGEPFGWTPAGRFESGRLDSWFYQPAYLKMETVLKARTDLRPVSQIASLVTDTVKWTLWPSETFEYYEIADLDDGSGVITSTSLPVREAPSRAKYIVEPADILISTVRPNRKAIAVIPEDACAAICSSGFSLLRTRDSAAAHYLHGCLLHDTATNQLMRWNTGATYPAIERAIPLDVLIPNPGEEQINELGSLLRNAARDLSEARLLSQSTSREIEKFLLGELDREQLLSTDEEFEEWLKQNPNAPMVKER